MSQFTGKFKLSLAGMHHTALPQSHIECGCGYNVDVLNTNIEYNFGKDILVMYLCPICSDVVHTTTYSHEPLVPHDKCQVLLTGFEVNAHRSDIIMEIHNVRCSRIHEILAELDRMHKGITTNVPASRVINETQAKLVAAKLAEMGAQVRIQKL